MGRPAFKPTAAERKKVEILRGAGMSEDSIRKALGVGHGTLRKYFPDELECGGERARSEVIECMFKAAKKGSVPAQRAYLALTGGLLPAASGEPKLGKKEIAKAAAETAHEGSEWGELVH